MGAGEMMRKGILLLLIILSLIPTVAATDPLADAPDATIAIVTVDPTHRSPVYFKQVLDAKGHTCTIIAIADVTATNLDNYDAIVLTRTGTEAQHTYIRAYIDKGIPVWAGITTGTGTLTAGGAITLGMVGKLSIVDTRNGDYLLDYTPSHPITDPYSTPSTISIYSSSTWMALAPRADGYVGTRIAEYSASDSSIAILAIEKNTPDLFGNPYGARCGFIGWLYSTGTITLTADAQDVLDRAIRWSLIEPTPTQTPTQTPVHSTDYPLCDGLTINAGNITTQAVTLSGSTPYPEVWIVLGAAPGKYGYQSSTITTNTSDYSATIVSLPLISGQTYYARAGTAGGYSPEVSFSLPALTPAPVTTHGDIFNTLMAGNLSIEDFWTAEADLYARPFGGGDFGLAAFISLISAFVFVILFLRSGDVIVPFVVAALIGGLLVPYLLPQFAEIGYAFMVAAMIGIGYSLYRRYL